MTAPTTPAPVGRGLWVGVVFGAPLMALTIVDALGDAGDTHPAELARWIVGGAVVVDLVVVPAALGVGRALGSSAWSRRLRWPLAASATLALVAWPFVRGYGRSAGNPSLLPRDYATGVAIAGATVWLADALVTVLELIGRRRQPRD